MIISRLILIFLLTETSALWAAAPPTLSKSPPAKLPMSRAPSTSAQTLTFRIRDEPETLDWNRARTSVEANLLNNIMEGLVALGPTQKLIPRLAKSWEVSPNGKVYTYHLRPGVQWTDGAILKAADFVYSWKRLLSPVTGAAFASLLFPIQGAEAFHKSQLTDFSQVGVKALDDLTLQVTLTQASAYWQYIPAFWATFPLRQEVVETQGAGWDIPGKIVTLGPFKLSLHDEHVQMVFTTHPNYYGSRPNVNQLIASMIPDDASALIAYKQGKLDILTDLATLDVTQDMSIKITEKKTFPQFKTGFLGFSTQLYPVSRVDVRRAIAMAIDKSQLVQLLHGGQKPATSFIPPGLVGYSAQAGLPFNVIRARDILRDTGIDFSRDLTIEYLLPAWDRSTQIATFVQNQLKSNLGIDVALKPMENKAYRISLGLRTFPLYDMTWTGDYPDPDSYASLFTSSSGNSFSGWKNTLYDQLTLQGRRISDPKVRQDMYEQAQRTLLEDQAVIVPLYYEPSFALVHDWVKGFQINALNIAFFKDVTTRYEAHPYFKL